MKNKKFAAVLLCGVIVIETLSFSAYKVKAAAVNSKVKSEIISNFNKESKGKMKYYEKDGRFFLSGSLSSKRSSTKQDALNFLEENKDVFGAAVAGDSFEAEKLAKDEKGEVFVTLNQKINGVKVRGKKIIVHYSSDGVIAGINGELQKEQEITRLGKSKISEAEAVKTAKGQFKYIRLRFEPTAQRLIISREGKLYEGFMINVFCIEPEIGNWNVFVEGSSGQVLEITDNIRHDSAVAGMGTSVSGESISLNLYQIGTSYCMIDMTKASPTEIRTYTMNSGTTSGTIISNSSVVFSDLRFRAGVSAHYNAGVVHDFYKGMFGRNSLDNAGMVLSSFVNYGSRYNGAFWDGYEMVYGDGDGTQFTYLSGDLDVVGHEMTHGVIGSTANFTYSDQSGALDESMADLFGVLIETYEKYHVMTKGTGAWVFNPGDWVIGDQVYTPGIAGDSLRNLRDPHQCGQPDNMSGYVTTSSDSGGVHTNSGIPNKAAASIAEAIGMEKTARIYYRALSLYMTPSTDFVQAYNCLHQSAADLYGEKGAEAAAVDRAFAETGIISGAFPVSGISLDREEQKLNKGQSCTLTAIVYPANAADKSVIWTSSDGDIASVDSQGKVNALGVGIATITAASAVGAYAASCKVTVTDMAQIRYGGSDRFETAAMASASGWSTSDSVVLAGADGFADALAGVPFAYIKDAPILLTYVDSLPEATDKEIARLNAKNIYILGGTSVVSEAMEQGLRSRGLNVQRISGADRFETGLAIGREVLAAGASKTAVLTTAYSYPDALAISPYAAISKYPILYTAPAVFTEKTKAFIEENGITKVIIPGMYSAVSQGIENELKAMGVEVQRIGGADRYATAYNIVNTFKDSFGNDVMLATGENFPDALSGGVLAAKRRIPILLVKQNYIASDAAAFISAKGSVNIYILGGTAAVSDNMINLINK